MTITLFVNNLIGDPINSAFHCVRDLYLDLPTGYLLLTGMAPPLIFGTFKECGVYFLKP